MSFQGWLKQSTAVTVQIGPFVDSTDGDTAETALSIAASDVRLCKNGGTPAAKNESSACTHQENGDYSCALDTTDTGTLGLLVMRVTKAGALKLKHTWMVVSANVYNSLVSNTGYLNVNAETAGGVAIPSASGRIEVNVTHAGGTAISQASGVLNVNATQISGDSTAADNLEAMFDGNGYAGGTIPLAVNVTQWRGTQPNTLVSNRVDATVGAMQADVVTAAAIAANAIGASELATDAAEEIAAAVLGAQVESEGPYTLQEAASIILAVLAGVTSGDGKTLKTPNGVATRVVATTNASKERTAMDLTPSS
jgi:hypothetical protein